MKALSFVKARNNMSLRSPIISLLPLTNSTKSVLVPSLTPDALSDNEQVVRIARRLHLQQPQIVLHPPETIPEVRLVRAGLVLVRTHLPRFQRPQRLRIAFDQLVVQRVHFLPRHIDLDPAHNGHVDQCLSPGRLQRNIEVSVVRHAGAANEVP